MGEVNTNPYKAGVFFQGSEFITDQFVQVFTELFADERLSIFVRISAKPSTTLLPMRHRYVSFTVDQMQPSFSFYHLSGSTLIKSGNMPTSQTRTFNLIGASQSPTVLVMTDENGDFRYITCNSLTLELSSSAIKPSDESPPRHVGDNLYQFFGSFIEFVALDGISIYHMTVNSSNVISFTLNRVEPERAQPLYISHGHNRPYVDGHLYIGHLSQMGDIASRIEKTEASFGGLSVPTVGIMKIALSDSYFDFVANQSWDTRTVEVLAGLTTQPINEYRVILRANTEYVEWDEDELKITLKDQSILFDRSIQVNTYAGTGGYEGSPEVKGRSKPLIFGFVAHATPILLDPNLNLYQFNDGASDQVRQMEIREGGVIRPNHILTSDILTWQPTAGEVGSGIIRIDYQRGVFRLAAPPAAPITFTKNGVTSVPLSSTLADIIIAILQLSAPELTIDTNSFDFHRANLAQEYGLYITDSISIADAIRQLTEPINDLVMVNGLNRVKLKHLTRGTVRAFIDERSLAIGSGVSRREAPKPGSIYRLAYEKTWTLLDESQILGAAQPIFRHLVQEEYRWNEYAIEPRSTSFPKRFDSSKIIELKSLLIRSHTDLLVEVALRDHTLRDLYDITVVGFSFMFEVGDTVLLQLSRWGMTVPRTMIIVEIVEMSPTIGTEDQTKLLLWG